MPNNEVLSQSAGEIPTNSIPEYLSSYPPHLRTAPGALTTLTEHATELDILTEAQDRVGLIHATHKNSLPENGSPDPMHIAFADAAVVAERELQREDGPNPDAVIKALHKHLSLRNKAQLIARKFRRTFNS